jgi:S-adenosylmethionine hydrolase
MVYLIGDHYVAQLKGCIRQISPDVEIFDICNTVQSYSLLQTGYILRTSYPFFPEGSIHLIGVNSEPSANNKIFLVKHEGHYFVGSDNGLYSIIFPDKDPEFAWELVPEMMYRYIPDLAPKSFFDPDLELKSPKKFAGFSALKIFATVVNHIINKRQLSLLGYQSQINRENRLLQAFYRKDSIFGNVVFIDHFGNIITNINRDLFESVGKGRSFGVYIRGSMKFAISKISTDYTTDDRQIYLALFNSSGALEIAQINDNLAQLETIDILSEVEIRFSQERIFF